MDNWSGKTVGNYQIIEELGRGGMAIVYKAYQPSLGRHVALKVLPPQFTFDPTFVERFLREARTAAKLEHPNIITIYDVGEMDGTYYISMQYVERGSLQKLINRVGALTPARTVYIVQQLASALDYAHRRKLIHRDIKPSNVLMGEQDHAILTDFGIARAAEGTRLTQTGILIGTPEYMSPEQARGDQVDRRSDIYSLGVVVYEMLTGRVPFSGTTAHSVLHKVVYEAHPPLRSVARRIPAALEEVVTRALAKKAGARYGSAGEMADALAQACGLSPRRTPTPVPKVPTPAPRAARRKRKAPAGAEAKAAGAKAEKAPRAAEFKTVSTAAEKVAPVPTPVPAEKPRSMLPILFGGAAVVAVLAVLLSRGRGVPSVATVTTPTPSLVVARATSTSIPTTARTPRPTSTPTERLPTSTPVPASPTATNTVKPSPTVARTATATAAPVARQPALELPPDEAALSGEVITFRWQWPRPLGADEYFDLRVWREGDPHYGIAWTKDTSFDKTDLAGGKWYWSVAVIRQTGPNKATDWEPVSEEGEMRWFNYSAPGRPSEPTKPPPPPEPTKPPPS